MHVMSNQQHGNYELELKPSRMAIMNYELNLAAWQL